MYFCLVILFFYSIKQNHQNFVVLFCLVDYDILSKLEKIYGNLTCIHILGKRFVLLNGYKTINDALVNQRLSSQLLPAGVDILIPCNCMDFYFFFKLLYLEYPKCSFRHFSWCETNSSTIHSVHSLRLGYFSTSSRTTHHCRGWHSCTPSQTALGSRCPFLTYSQRTSYAIRPFTTITTCRKQRALLSSVWWALLERPRVWAQSPKYRVPFPFTDSCRCFFPFLAQKCACLPCYIFHTYVKRRFINVLS